MKEKFLSHVKEFLKTQNFNFEEIILSKSKQSNKKPAYFVKVNSEVVPLSLYIYETNQKEMVLGKYPNDVALTSKDFSELVQKTIKSINNSHSMQEKLAIEQANQNKRQNNRNIQEQRQLKISFR